MNYYVTNIKPAYLWFERTGRDLSGGYAFEFIETEDGRWALPEDCYKWIQERYSGKYSYVKESDVSLGMTTLSTYSKYSIEKDIPLKKVESPKEIGVE